MSKSREQSPITFNQLLTIMLIGLYLTDHIDWAWYWLICPILIEFVINFLFTIIDELWDKD